MENVLFRQWYILVQLHSREPSTFRKSDDPNLKVTSDLPPAAKHLFLSRTCSLGSSAPFKIIAITNFDVIPWELPVSRRSSAGEDWQDSFLNHRRWIAWIKPNKFRPQTYFCLGLLHRPSPFRILVFLGGGVGARQPPLGQGLLIYEVSRSHTTTHHSR